MTRLRLPAEGNRRRAFAVRILIRPKLKVRFFVKIGHMVSVLVCAAGIVGLGGPATFAFADSGFPSSPSSPFPGIPSPSLGDTLAGVPFAPIASAADSSAVVTIAAAQNGELPAGGLPASYLIQALPGNASCRVSGATGSCTVTGLTNGTAYTFTAIANDAAGSSAQSPPSNSVTPTGVPTTPYAPLAVPGVNSAFVIEAAAAVEDGGYYPDFYTVTANPGGGSCTINTIVGGCTIDGLTAGANYIFTVTAQEFGANSNSPGASSTASAPSNVITVSHDEPASGS
jgi:hypothetical protein